MMIYPYSSPIILTEDIFVAHGGLTGTSTPAQRQIAFTVAEERVSDDLGTFLLPTTVTGTYGYKPFIVLDHSYLLNVMTLQFLDDEHDVYWSDTGSYTEYYRIYEDTYGIVDVEALSHICGCSQRGYPYHVRIIYEAGLPTGTANHPNILMALSGYAQIILNEVVGYGNESVGDAGVQSFSNQEYSETRKKLMNTAYGNSAKAQFIHKMLNRFRKYRYSGI